MSLLRTDAEQLSTPTSGSAFTNSNEGVVFIRRGIDRFDYQMYTNTRYVRSLTKFKFLSVVRNIIIIIKSRASRRFVFEFEIYAVSSDNIF